MMEKLRDVAQLGSAPRSGRGGRRFKSCHPDFFKLINILFIVDRACLSISNQVVFNRQPFLTT